MDFEFIRQNVPMYQMVTLLIPRIAPQGVSFSFLLGLFYSLTQYYKVLVLYRIAGVYIELPRNTLLLVQLSFLYFGLSKLGVVISSKSCAVIGLVLLGGSYMVEASRSGLESMKKGQLEAGFSIELEHLQIIRCVALPQALSVSVPALCTNVIFLTKKISAFSVVALTDLMCAAKGLIGLYYETDEALSLLVTSYLIILLSTSIVSLPLERRPRYAGFGN